MIEEQDKLPGNYRRTFSNNCTLSIGYGIRIAKIDTKTFIAVLIALLMIASASGNDLITIKLEGTSIDVLPDSVEVYVADPHEAGEELVKKGGKRYEKAKNGDNAHEDLVRYRRVDYYYKLPATVDSHNLNHQFKLGDTLYVFNVETEEEVKSFVNKYLLKKGGTIRFGPRTKDLYVAKPGYFVLFPIKTTIYYCPIDPKQENDREGTCPICGMPFSKMKGYQ